MDLPVIRRARGFRLYTDRGKRLLDLWEDNGKALLGHKPPSVLREVKNCAERGLTGPFPGVYEARLRRALEKLLPGFSFRLFSDKYELLYDNPFIKISNQDNSHILYDPAIDETCKDREAALWRPFLPLPPAPVMLMMLPCPWPGTPLVLAYAQGKGDKPETQGKRPISPLSLAALARTVYDLIAVLEDPKKERTTISPALEAAIAGSSWEKRGIYLHYKGTAPWADVEERFLQAGFLIPPSPRQPLIVPSAMSPGESSALCKILQTIPAS